MVNMDDNREFLPVEFSCFVCKKKGFRFATCGSCERVKLCENPLCYKDHSDVCSGHDVMPECDIDKGQVLEIEETEVDAASRFLDLGSSNSCVRHGHNQHGDYIDYAQFTVNDLPQEIQHPDMYNFIIAKAQKTVRITSKWTSMKRPDSDPYAHQRGKKRSRVASGYCMTYATPDSFGLKICEVPDCHRTADLGPEHYILSGEVYIYTNKHVVFDEEEMMRTSVEFFYDAYNKFGVVKEYGLNFSYTKNVSDRTFFTITIHDESFLRCLLDITNDFIIKSNSLSNQLLQNLEPYIIIVSHPHGMPKKVSIGKVVQSTEHNVSPETERNAKQFGKLYKIWARSGHDAYVNLLKKRAMEAEIKEDISDVQSSDKKLQKDMLSCTDTFKATGQISKKDHGHAPSIEQGTNDKGSRVLEKDRNLSQGNDEDSENRRANVSHSQLNDENCSASQLNEHILNFSCEQGTAIEPTNQVDSVKCKTIRNSFGNTGTSGELGKSKEETKQDCLSRDSLQSGDIDAESRMVNYNSDGKVDGEDDMVDFMSTTSFPVVTVFHTAPTCQGSSGAPVIHKGFHVDNYWIPLIGGHFGYDLNLCYSFFRYNKATT